MRGARIVADSGVRMLRAAENLFRIVDSVRDIGIRRGASFQRMCETRSLPSSVEALTLWKEHLEKLLGNVTVVLRERPS